MKTKEEIIKILKSKKDFLKKKYKVKNIALFGSYVRGENRPTSDIDILVEFYEPISLLKFIELENYLSDILGTKVDLVVKSALKKNIKKHVFKEMLEV
ncbi:MAG TPA: nucleotidyltransferase [Persephonella sp.]|nr:nucleotidyltransferase [Persephonella sp.]